MARLLASVRVAVAVSLAVGAAGAGGATAACGAYASDAPSAPAATDGEGGERPDAPEEQRAPAGATADAGAAGDVDSGKPSSEAARLEVVLSGRPIQAFAIGATRVFTLETDVQTRLVAVDKAAPHAVHVLLEEDVLDGVRFESVGFARGRVFFVDSYGYTRSAKEDGSDVRREDVLGSPTRILSAPRTLWLASPPRFVGDYLELHWFGPDASKLPLNESRLIPTLAVGDLAADDEALVYATRGSTKTLRQWAPAAVGLAAARRGDRLLATLPEEGVGVGVDAQRAYAYLPAAKEIRAFDRTTGAASAVLSGATFDTAPQLRSDGTYLYLLGETALRRCSLASCAGTMTVLASSLTAARALVVESGYAWIVMAPKGKTGVIARVKL